MASMDLQQANVTLLEQLRQENDHLIMLLLAKQNQKLRAKSFVSSGEDVLKEPEASSGREPTTGIQDALDESKFRRDLQPSGLKAVHRTSSLVNFESFIKSSAHTEPRVKPESSVSGTVKDSERLVGEIAFQLDRRILSHVFQSQTRIYGFTVLNIPDKIIQLSTHPLTGRVDKGFRRHLSQRYTDLMGRLSQLGYNGALHPLFTEFVINTYGILRQRPDSRSPRDVMDYNNADALREVIVSTAPGNLVKDLLLLLSCLSDMARRDGKPLLLW
ncbi:hypothetical protein NHX12_001589 [Muraenolepis orangiensis]|uniref:Speriolin C-terminal domain-containing protein n=1 Tax=Muraenolepis orangiensis TaxID=630683 RepID=A0A9Q0IHC3_9TELE|nr:hypothetical protein NHX12_001589 [Muraenolepis orangiensis]